MPSVSREPARNLGHGSHFGKKGALVLLYRFNAAHQRWEGARDFFIDNKRTFLAPSVTWKPGTDTSLSVDVTYTDQTVQFDRGLVAVGDRVAPIPLSRYLGEAFSTYDAEETRARVLLDHRFNDTWSMRTAARAVLGNDHRFSADPRGVARDNRTLNRRVLDSRSDTYQYSFNNDLTTEFNTGAMEHRFLFGLDATYGRRDHAFRTASLTSIDMFNPVYGARPGAFGTPTLSDDRLTQVGTYVQNQMDLTHGFKALAGIRFDHAAQDSRFNGVATKQIDNAWSPRFGLVHQPTDTITLYANYAHSFRPQLGRTFDGNTFDPLVGRQVEAGIKMDVTQALTATLAAFQITQQNVLTADPSNSGFSIQTGEQRSRGVELDLVGQLAPGWKLIASAAVMNAKVTADSDPANVGNRLAGVPRLSGSLWTSYDIQSGPLSGLGFGAGLFAAGERQGDLANTFAVDGYVRADAAVWYQITENVKARVSVQNLFDADYIESPVSRTEIYPGAPLTAYGTLSLTF